MDIRGQFQLTTFEQFLDNGHSLLQGGVDRNGSPELTHATQLYNSAHNSCDIQTHPLFKGGVMRGV